MMTRVYFCLVLCVCIAGCNGGSEVKGKVTFDDGSPLTVGTVQFNTDTEQMVGEIQKDGTYWMSHDGKKNGIPNGLYKVAIGFADEPTGAVDDSDRPIMRSLIDEKFRIPETSGLTCEVKGSTTFDIIVTKPIGKQ